MQFKRRFIQKRKEVKCEHIYVCLSLLVMLLDLTIILESATSLFSGERAKGWNLCQKWILFWSLENRGWILFWRI